MNEIGLRKTGMPVMLDGDYVVSAESFMHVDRRVDFHDMIFVTEGVVYVTEEEEDYSIYPGEILFLKAGCHHYGKTMIPAGTSWYYAHFKLEQPDECRKTEESIPNQNVQTESSEIVCGKDDKELIRIPKKIVAFNHSKLEESLKRVMSYFHAAENQKKWMVNTALFDFLVECAFWEQEEAKEEKLSVRIATYLTEHLQEPFRAEETSKAFSLSYKYLAAVFKKDRGMSMQQYHNQIRMQEACRLLRSTGLSVNEIATRLGFTDALYFSRCFHQCVLCSPKQYRRNLRY